MPAKIENGRPVIASFTILPEQKQWLEQRARALSLKKNMHISSSTLIRMLIDQYAEVVQQIDAYPAVIQE